LIYESQHFLTHQFLITVGHILQFFTNISHMNFKGFVLRRGYSQRDD